MTLPIFYIGFYLLTIALIFVHSNKYLKYKRIAIISHYIIMLFLFVTLFLVNLKGALIERIIVIAFLISAAAIFSLYRRDLKLWQNLYFGFFLFYPIFALISFLFDRLFFVIVASPLLVTLMVPKTKFITKDYEVREITGLLSPYQLELIKSGNITEKQLGISNDEILQGINISGLQVLRSNKDTTWTIIYSKGKNHEVIFY